MKTVSTKQLLPARATSMLIGTLATGSVLTIAVSTEAATLAEYDFENYGNAANRASNVDPADASASAYTAVSGTPFSNASDSHAGNPTDSWYDALADSSLLGSFTVTADPGLFLDLSSLEFAYGAESILTPSDTVSYEVFVNDTLVFESGDITGTNASLAFQADIDLTDAEFQGIAAATVEFFVSTSTPLRDANIFRLFGSPSTTYGSDIGETNPNMTLTGAVVPEPTTGALALLGLGALAMRRRRG